MDSSHSRARIQYGLSAFAILLGISSHVMLFLSNSRLDNIQADKNEFQLALSDGESRSFRTRRAAMNVGNNSRTATARNQGRRTAQGLTAIHLHAPVGMVRQYESGSPLSRDSSATDNVYRFWRKANWVRNTDDIFYLDEQTGHVTVERDGVYMIYAQVVYHDVSGRWSFGVYVGDQEKVKCLATEQLKDLSSFHPTSHGVYKSCYTAIVLQIRKNQSVSIRCMYGTRTILTSPEFTFWGMIRLA